MAEQNDLETQVLELQEENERLEADNSELTSKLQATITESKRQADENAEALRIQEEAALEADDRIAELEAQVASLSEKTADQPATNLPTVEIDGKVYRFTAPRARVNGRKLTAEQITEDEELLGQLVEQGSGILQPV